jgi:hypothetical protein
MVQGWYQGGISVFDFTDSAHPVEIAFFDRGPVDDKELILAGHWSAYWNNGFIYGSEIARGVDVLRLTPSEYLSQNEIEAASLVQSNEVNTQQQRRIAWPKSPVVARAYVDQLVRSGAIPSERADSVRAVVARADDLGAPQEGRAVTAAELEGLATQLRRGSAAASERDVRRIEALAATLQGLATKLR